MENYVVKPSAPVGKRPKLSADNVEAYLDWVTSNVRALLPVELDAHLRAAEMVIRTRAVDAQNKATQHTLVEQGVIDQPNA